MSVKISINFPKVLKRNRNLKLVIFSKFIFLFKSTKKLRVVCRRMMNIKSRNSFFETFILLHTLWRSCVCICRVHSVYKIVLSAVTTFGKKWRKAEKGNIFLVSCTQWSSRCNRSECRHADWRSHRSGTVGGAWFTKMAVWRLVRWCNDRKPYGGWRTARVSLLFCQCYPSPIIF